MNGALLESVRQEPTANALPIVLFLTDGLPTVGETDEVKIREAVGKQNPYRRRIFTVGVGVDVNTPLLETIATETRAQPAFVLPTENIKTKITEVFRSLENPILADARLEILNASGPSVPARTMDVFPNPLPDLFQEDHLVVLGRYQGSEPSDVPRAGELSGREENLRVHLSSQRPAGLSVCGPAVGHPQNRGLGPANPPLGSRRRSIHDPQQSRTRPELENAGRRHPPTDDALWDRHRIHRVSRPGNHRTLSRKEQLNLAYRNLDQRAVKTRVGLSSVNQSINNSLLGRQHYLNGGNYYWDANMRRVAVPGVQQLGSGAYFLRGSTWVDGRLADQAHITPQQVVRFGSPAYEKLLKRLVTKGEHTPLSLNGNVLMQIDNQPILVCPPPDRCCGWHPEDERGAQRS